MSFNVRCEFSGLCAYVPNKPLYRTGHTVNESPAKMWIMMVDAREWKASSIDERYMQPHFPVALIDASNLPGSGFPTGGKIVWPLDRRRVSFQVAQNAPQTLEVLQGIRDQVQNSQRDRDFTWGADLREIAPEFAKIDPRCFQDAESAGLISSKVYLDCGRLVSGYFNSVKVPKFGFDSVFGANFAPRPLSNRAILELDGVDSFRLLSYSLDDPEEGPEIVDLSPGKGDTVKLTIGNLCDGCLPRNTPAPDVPSLDDDDFRWYYELCIGKAQMQPLVKGSPTRTVPIPDPGGVGGPGAIQCMRVSFAEEDF